MLREALLLLVDIKLLYVKYHLLLQAPLVVLGNRNLRQAFFDTRAYFSDSLLLVKVDSSQQFAYSLDALGKEPLKSLSFGTTVSHKTLHCRRHCLGKSRSIGVIGRFRSHRVNSVGKAQKHRVPVGRLGNTQSRRSCGNLLLIRLKGIDIQCYRKGGIDSRKNFR